jgi:hypothetical protein
METKRLPSVEEVLEILGDINHPIRRAYIEYVRECRVDGVNPLPCTLWIEEGVSRDDMEVK